MMNPERCSPPLAKSGGSGPRLPRQTARRAPPRVLTRAQVSDLIRAPIGRHQLRDRALISMAYATLARVSEVVGCNVESLEDNGRVRLYRRKVKDWIVQPLSEVARGRIRDYLTHRRRETQKLSISGPLWLSQKGGRLSIRQVREMVGKWGLAAGIPDVHPHLLRHSAATHLIENGVDVVLVQSLLGHKRLDQVLTYLHVAVGPLDDAVEGIAL